MKKTYVAGALNSSDCIGYLKNVSRMMQTAEDLRQLGVAPFIPGIDLLMGIKFGNYEYNDFFDCSQMWLESSDFMFLVPQWEDSKGTRREIERAGKHGIPIFMDYDEVKEFLKPVIICIVGESGSGKTLMAEWFEKLFHYNLIRSYTTRPRRTEYENGHTFISDVAFDKFNFDNEEMIAFTKFGEYRYCCLHKDVEYYNTYVIDEVGLNYLKQNYSEEFHIYSIRVKAKEEERKYYASPERIKRDKGVFKMKDNEFDFIFNNIYDLGDLVNFVQVTHNSVFSDFVSKCYNV